MTPLSGTQSGGNPVGQDVALSRLFQFDLPRLKQSNQLFPEQGDTSATLRVLDIASGSGEWTISAAQAAPQVQFVGIERDERLVEQARSQALAQGVENVNFIVMNPFQPLDLPAGSFDLINARYIVGMLPASDWSNAIREFMRIARPGGILRLTETDLPITSSPALAQLGALISQTYCQTKRSFSPDGRLLSVTPALKRLLQDAGCQDVQQAVWTINFSTEMSAHTEVCQSLAQTYQLVLPFLVSNAAITQEEAEQTYQQMLTQMQSERFDALAFSLTVWGTTPS
ncbi:MAG TPA: class I SAM-dependent methyltransferase [Ktedonobacteraceae bacterium]|nr:class I SAM-dependent methyltransferase [Ktedonobacteraceae bacterium]